MPANYAKQTMGYDVAFGLNEFNEPKLVSEIETIKNVIIFILFSKPGSYPSLPMIGIDIEHYLYSYYDDIDPEELKAQIMTQCALLGQYIHDGTIEIRKEKYHNEPSLFIDVNGTVQYPLSYKTDKTKVISGFHIGITYDELKDMVYNITNSYT